MICWPGQQPLKQFLHDLKMSAGFAAIPGVLNIVLGKVIIECACHASQLVNFILYCFESFLDKALERFVWGLICSFGHGISQHTPYYVLTPSLRQFLRNLLVQYFLHR